MNIQLSGDQAPSVKTPKEFYSGKKTNEKWYDNQPSGKQKSELQTDEKRTNEFPHFQDKKVDSTIQPVQSKTKVNYNDKSLVYRNELTNNVNYVLNGSQKNNTTGPIDTESSYHIEVCKAWEELCELVKRFDDDYDGIALPSYYRREKTMSGEYDVLKTFKKLFQKTNEVERQINIHNQAVRSSYCCCKSDLYKSKQELISKYRTITNEKYWHLVLEGISGLKHINITLLKNIYDTYIKFTDSRKYYIVSLPFSEYTDIDKYLGIEAKEIRLLYTKVISEINLEIQRNLRFEVIKHLETLDSNKYKVDTYNNNLENIDHNYPGHLEDIDLEIEGEEEGGL